MNIGISKKLLLWLCVAVIHFCYCSNSQNKKRYINGMNGLRNLTTFVPSCELTATIFTRFWSPLWWERSFFLLFQFVKGTKYYINPKNMFHRANWQPQYLLEMQQISIWPDTNFPAGISAGYPALVCFSPFFLYINQLFSFFNVHININ